MSRINLRVTATMIELNAEQEQHRAVDPQRTAGKRKKRLIRRKDPRKHARETHHECPDERGIAQAHHKQHAIRLLDALDILCAEVIAQDRLCAL